MAYCLLGLFGVNVPLLYGGGDNAFLRLQEEIMRRLEDHFYLAGFRETIRESFRSTFFRS